jgi:hypothetical protein
MYSLGYYEPPVSANEYTTQVIDFNTTQATFYSTRPLNPGLPNSYVIPLDEGFSIVYAWFPTPYLEFHEGNVGTLTVTLLSAGGCVIGEVVPV